MIRHFVAYRKLLSALPLIVLSLTILTACEGEKPEQTTKVAVQGVISAALPKAADYAVIGSLQHGGSLWNLSNLERLYNWNHQGGQFSSLRAVGISGDSRIATTVVGADIVVWEVSTGQSLNFWRAPDKIMAMQLGQQGRYAILGLQNSQAVYFDIERGQARQEFQHEAEVFGVAISADGKLAMTGSDDRTARIWRLEDGALLHRFEHGNQVKTVALSDDGALAFSTAQREEAVVWDTTSGSAKSKVDVRYANFTSARFSEDSSKLALGTFRGDVFLVDTATGAKVKHWKAKSRQVWGPASSGAILSVAFQPDGKIIAVSSDGLLQQFGG